MIVTKNSIIEDGCDIGDHTSIGDFCHIQKGSKIGEGCKIKDHVTIWDKVEIGDDVFVGPSVVFTNDLTPRAYESKQGVYIPTLVGRGASIGANATIVCGITIGEYSAIGAGSVVTKDVESYTLVYGNPAKFIRKISKNNLWE